MRIWCCLLFLLAACGNRPENTPEEPDPDPSAQQAQAEPRVVNPPLMMGNGETVTIYYHHPIVDGVVPREKKIFRHLNLADQVKQVIDHLTIAPEDGYGIPIWPEDTYVRELYMLRDGMVVIDFDEVFLDRIAAGANREVFLVYSLVNSILDNFPSFNKVQILIHGTVRETFLGHIDIEQPLERNFQLYTVVPDVREEDSLIEEDLVLQPPPTPISENLPQEDLN